MGRITFEGNFCDIAMCRENPCPYNGMCSQRETWERLKKYEDAEKEGHLVMLPCKVGDKVYQIDAERVYESEVKGIIYDAGHIDFDERAIGKTVFLTSEEAEAALKGGEG